MKTVGLATVVGFLVTVGVPIHASSVALAADKSSTPFVNTSSTGSPFGFINGTSTGLSKVSGCTIQIELKKLRGLSDGAQVICIGSADVKTAALPGGAGVSVVWIAPVVAGNVKIKNSVSVFDENGVHCGSAQAVAWNGTTTCYQYTAAYDPAAVCAGQGGVWSWAPAGTVFLVGLCQGPELALDFRILPPSSPKLAETGMTILTGAK
jgi:hypothetical protein